jgi:hypothetical protein
MLLCSRVSLNQCTEPQGGKFEVVDAVSGSVLGGRTRLSRPMTLSARALS